MGMGPDDDDTADDDSGDDDTDLTWTDNVTGSMCCRDSYQSTHVQFADALTYCGGLELDGDDNRRVLSIDELRSLARGIRRSGVRIPPAPR
ncbi:MAG: hypothetical protein IT350_14565 [Deltaproteobacteria bacterium]|nr:hypothetical protein [Deltaproteobacteria bacterium]